MQCQLSTYPRTSCIPIKPSIRLAPRRLPNGTQSRDLDTTVCAQHPVGALDVLEEQILKKSAPDDVRENETMDWDKCWYPVALVEDLEPKRPTPVKLLGRDFVLWRDVNKEWRCFDDACPHRLAPLSEGRIEPSDGSLMCSYHGWRFQSDGECTRIPQAKDGGAAGGCKNPRSRAKAFPVQMASNLVWIWPDDSDSAFIDSAMSTPHGLESDADDELMLLPNYIRDLDYPFDILIENIMDPSHVAFAHHGVQGRRGDRDNMESHSLNVDAGKKSLFFHVEDLRNGDRAPEKHKVIKRTLEYSAPDYISYKYMNDSGDKISRHMIVHAIPTSSTTCRAISRMYWAKPPFSIFSIFLNLIMKRKWFNHLYSHLIFDGDTILLHEAANKLRAAEAVGKSWKTEYYMPASCDVPAFAFRRWFHGKIGNGGPTFPGLGSSSQDGQAPMSRRKLLDRFHTHTKHCKACQGALRNIIILKNAAQVAAVGMLVWNLAIIRSLLKGAGATKFGLVACAAGCVALGFLARSLGILESYFHYKDYEHWKT